MTEKLFTGTLSFKQKNKGDNGFLLCDRLPHKLMHDAYYCLKHYNDLIKGHNIHSYWVANWSKEFDCVVHVHNFKLQNVFEMHKLKLSKMCNDQELIPALKFKVVNN